MKAAGPTGMDRYKSAISIAAIESNNPVKLRDLVNGYLGMNTEVLIEEMRLLGEDIADLKAKRDMWKANRDAMQARLVVEIRQDLIKKNQKPTDGLCLSLALSREDYQAWLNEVKTDLSNLSKLENEKEAIDKLIDYYRTIIYFGKAEMNK